MKQAEWTETALEDMAVLDHSVAIRIKKAVERLADHPPEFRLRVGDWRVRFHQDEETIRVLRVLNRSGAYR